MEKKSKVGIAVILLIIIAIAAYLIYTYGSDSNVENKVNIANNTVVNNVVENKAVENEIKNTSVENTEVTNNVSEEKNQDTEVVTGNEREIAMNIAKEAWGDTDGVYFQMEETQKPNGDYIISVSADAKVLAWYYVNASKGTYTVEYN